MKATREFRPTGTCGAAFAPGASGLSRDGGNEVNTEVYPCLKINAPHFFRRAGFVRWLNKRDTFPATWHRKGSRPNEYSDLFITYDHGEGSDSDMPKSCWEEICAAARKAGMGYGVVWITNLRE